MLVPYVSRYVVVMKPLQVYNTPKFWVSLLFEAIASCQFEPRLRQCCVNWMPGIQMALKDDPQNPDACLYNIREYRI